MARLKRIAVGIVFLVQLLALTEIAFAEPAPPIDMSVSKIACNDTGVNVAEVSAGTDFYYNITVENPSDFNATDVVITDKLPYDVGYNSVRVLGADGVTILNNVTIHKTGDLLYVRFTDSIPALTRFFINISVAAPAEAPDTLYNIVRVRYANDPDPEDNTFTLATYVPLEGYDKSAAVESFEGLLHHQTRLLFDFEDLLHVIPDTPEENYTFITSFEQLLRAQANLSLSFEDLLENESHSGWDLGNFTEQERIAFLKSFNRIIWDEAFLFSSYEMKLKDAWTDLDMYQAPGHSQDAQTEFIASFEDLLKEQVKLFDSYQLLVKTIDIDEDVRADALAAFENLLRVQANLLMSFEDVLKMKYEGGVGPACEELSIETDHEDFGNEGTAFLYTINITNLASDPVELDTLTANYKFIDNASIQQTACLLIPTTGPNPSAGWTSISADNVCSGIAEYDTSLIGPIAPGATATVTLALHVSGTVENPTGKCYNTVCATWDDCSTCNLTEIEKTSVYPVPLQVGGEASNSTTNTTVNQTV
jgi:uncharacterized repeat protein (TIGR01451 family)